MWSSLSNMAPDTYKKAITSLARNEEFSLRAIMLNYFWSKLQIKSFGDLGWKTRTPDYHAVTDTTHNDWPLNSE